MAVSEALTVPLGIRQLVPGEDGSEINEDGLVQEGVDDVLRE